MTPEQISKLREDLGFGRSEFARVMGIAVVAVWRWETGECEPSGPARKLLEYLARGLVKLNPEEFKRRPGRKPKLGRKEWTPGKKR